jgi:NADPH-dependent F420 reductase
MTTSIGTSIGLVGAGGMGRSILRTLTHAGHDVTVADRDPQEAASAAAEASTDGPGRPTAAPLGEALASDIVILAIWYPGTVELARAHGDTLRGTILVDVANPLDATYTGLTVEPTTSAAEELAKAVPGSRIVKAFNTLPSTTLAAGRVEGRRLDTFVASDDDGAKAQVLGLLQTSGMRALDGGALASSRLLERLTAFTIELSQRYDTGSAYAFGFQPAADLMASA